jgi:Domain of unknown function (DUF4349)
MKTQFLTFIIAISVSIFACNSNSTENASSEVHESTTSVEMKSPSESSEHTKIRAEASIQADAVANTYYENGTVPIQTSIDKKKIIKNGNISIKSTDNYASKSKLDDLLKKYNGYYDSEGLDNNEKTISYHLRIRVKASVFEQFLKELENGEDEIVSKSITANDVTEEYIDIETRLENKREFMKRYRELLSKASSVKDVLAIQENIRVLQEEIESQEGRLKYLNDQVSYSSLYIDLFKEKEYVYKAKAQDKFSERVKSSLGKGWTSIVNFCVYIISIWPIIVLVIISILTLRKLLKRRNSK